MAAEVLATYVAHDARHDLESAIWLLLCMVLRHTLQVRPTDQGEFERYELYLRCFDATTESDSFDKKNSFLTNLCDGRSRTTHLSPSLFVTSSYSSGSKIAALRQATANQSL